MPTNRRFQHLFHVVDWVPTIAELLGIQPTSLEKLDGISQVQSLSEDKPKRTELFGGYACCNDHNQRWWGPSLRYLNYKIVQGGSGGPDETNPNPPGTDAIQLPGGNESGNQTTPYLLFDLLKDPQEQNNIAHLYPNVLQDMINKLRLYRKSFVYPQSNDDSLCKFTGLVNDT
jgi:arylsulfatase A-like enzyme